MRGLETTPRSRGGTAESAGELPQQVFQLEGEYWTIAYDSRVFRLRDGKGMHYLAHLLRHPGERCPAAELLARGTPCGGDAAAGAERARTAVTKRIKAAIKKIAEHDAVLGYHLARVIKTGRECAYTPDPVRKEAWIL